MCNEGARSPTRANVRYPMKYSSTLPAVGKSGSCAAGFEKDGLEIFTGIHRRWIANEDQQRIILSACHDDPLGKNDVDITFVNCV